HLEHFSAGDIPVLNKPTVAPQLSQNLTLLMLTQCNGHSTYGAENQYPCRGPEKRQDHDESTYQSEHEDREYRPFAGSVLVEKEIQLTNRRSHKPEYNIAHWALRVLHNARRLRSADLEFIKPRRIINHDRLRQGGVADGGDEVVHQTLVGQRAIGQRGVGIGV